MAKAGERMDLVVMLPIRQSAEEVSASRKSGKTHQISQKKHSRVEEERSTATSWKG